MIACSVCGSIDWLRCDPGQSSDASDLTPDQRQALLVFPAMADERPVIAWCAACDPVLGHVAAAVGPGEAEWLSWCVI